MTQTSKTISGTITDIARKEGTNGEYVEVSVLQPGQNYPTKCRAFDEELVEDFRGIKKGAAISLTITESPGTYQGRPITYRNIVDFDDDPPVSRQPAPNTQQSTPSQQTPTPRGEPTPDRQDLIMLQHASGVVGNAYGDWYRLLMDIHDPEERVAFTFSSYLKAIAQGATWYLKNVYQQGGYALEAPVRPRSAPEKDEPVESHEEEGDAPF